MKIDIAEALIDAGIRKIKVTLDYPPRTGREDLLQIIDKVHDSGGKVIIHGRASKDDIERILSYDSDGCAIYIAVSKLHREYKLHGIGFEDAIQRLGECASIAQERGPKYIRAILEDESRFYLDDREYAVNCVGYAVRALAESGATIVSLPDTSRLLSPNIANEFIRDMKRVSILPLAAHFHNDYGMASANAIEAALAGADEIHVSIMGIGDRSGISDLYDVAAVLEDQYGIKTGVNKALRSIQQVDFIQVYGDCDMIIRIRLTCSQDNVISLIRSKFSDAIQELKILPTDQVLIMGKSIFSKIWDRHLLAEEDGLSLIYIDRHLTHEVTSPIAFNSLRNSGRRVRRPDLTFAVTVHNVPTTDRSLPIIDELSRRQIIELMMNCEEFGITSVTTLKHCVRPPSAHIS